MIRPCAVLLVLGVLPAQEAAEDRTRQERLARAVTIYRDSFGVPHVYGESDAATVFGFMYARAEDEFARIERAHYTAAGRAAEVLGEAGLPWDALIAAYRIEDLARAELERMSPELRELCVAAMDALNFYVRVHGVPTKVIERFEPWHAVAASYMFHMTGVGRSGIDYSALAETTPLGRTRDFSNVWAIAPSRTADGHALLFANPHIPLHEVYEGHLHSESGWHVSGMVAYGSMLFPILGHNEDVAWSLTVNMPDLVDVYEVAFDDPEKPTAYRYDGGHREAEEWAAEIGVLRGEDVIPQRVHLMRTHHGPILETRDGKRLAVRVANLESGGVIGQLFEMTRAESVDEFKVALEPRALSHHNLMCADREGHIYYVYNGPIPVRNQAFDWTKPVDGSDPDADWQGYYELSSLPQVQDPEIGYLQNCNSTPFATTTDGQNPDPADFPAHLVGRDPMNERAKMSRRLLESRDDWTFDRLTNAAFDRRVYGADTAIPLIEHRWSELRKVDAERADQLAEVVEELRRWDRHAALDSVGTTVFMLWYERAIRNSAATAMEDLETTVRELEEKRGTWRVAWGDLNRHQRRDVAAGELNSSESPSLPIAGAHGVAGVVFTFLARWGEQGQQRFGYHGHSYVSVIELGERVRSRSIVPFGQSRDPDSPHYEDQAPLYAAGKLKPAWFWRDEVEANANESYHPGERR